MGERDFEQLKSIHELNVRARLICQKYKEIHYNGNVPTFEVFTRAFPDTPDFQQVYEGNLKKFSGKSLLTVERQDSISEQKRGVFKTTEIYTPSRYILTQHTPYDENKKSIVRYVSVTSDSKDFYEEFFPKVTTKDGLINMGKPELVKGFTWHDINIWNEILTDLEIFDLQRNLRHGNYPL